MRRSALAIIGTVAGTALMLGAKLGTAPPDDPAATAASDTGPAAAGDPNAGGAPAGAPGAVPGPSKPAPAGGSTSTAPGTPTPPAGGGKTTAPAPPPTTKPIPGGMKDGTYTGSAGVSRYGYTVSVSITISGGRITAATGSCGSASGESKSYCTGAIPKLQQETLSAQSASVATVSGATYTSRAYKSSLQAAIDASKA